MAAARSGHATRKPAGFDILLVRDDGAQLGVEAKLAVNVDVFRQILPERHTYSVMQRGPDYRAILVPDYAVTPKGLGFLCFELGIGLLTTSQERLGWSGRLGAIGFSPGLPRSDIGPDGNGWMEWCPAERCAVPDYVPDVAAGATAPVKLTPWKIAAIKLLIVARRRPVIRRDFKHFGLDARRWIDPRTGWLESTGAGWIIGPHTPTLWLQHPRNWAEIEANYDRWAPPAPAALI
jgi:hypothetical protein